MNGLFTVFSVWQFVLNLTVSKPVNLWDPVGFPIPPSLPTNNLEVIDEDKYNPRKLFELKLLNDAWVQVPIIVIADQDKLSASKETKGLFASPSLRGYLRYNLQTMDNFTIEWSHQFNYTSNLNSKGRGMELSDLLVFNGKLYAADDKTSIIFR